MLDTPKFEINLDDKFNGGKPLSNPPVIEAVIHWRTRSENKIAPHAFFEALQEKLPDYPVHQPQHEVQMQFEAAVDGSAASQTHKANWHGFRFESQDKLHVAQFTRNGFVFSRLRRYEQWEQFTGEAIRLWNIYVELVRPSELERLGVRFINVIELANPGEVADWLTNSPTSPIGLPLRGFMHQSSFAIPGHAYNLSVIQTIQPSTPPNSDGIRLILDLDVFTVDVPVSTDNQALIHRFNELRWLKNKAFSTYLTSQAIERFK